MILIWLFLLDVVRLMGPKGLMLVFIRSADW